MCLNRSFAFKDGSSCAIHTCISLPRTRAVVHHEGVGGAQVVMSVGLLELSREPITGRSSRPLLRIADPTECREELVAGTVNNQCRRRRAADR